MGRGWRSPHQASPVRLAGINTAFVLYKRAPRGLGSLVSIRRFEPEKAVKSSFVKASRTRLTS